jgi:predicted ribosomally synthesized peptide with SipW-like signal peptide
MKKLSLIMLALVVALGGLGLGYAAWTDTVTVDGTVTTGNLDIEVVNQSNTWVWKITGDDQYPDEIAVLHQYEFDPDNSLPPPTTGTATMIAYADADCPVGSPPTPDDTVSVVFHNLFPEIDFVADFLLHYSGSVPAKVQVADITATDIDGDAYDIAGSVTVKYYEATWDPNTPEIAPVKGAEILTLKGVQMHYCDYVLVEIHINVEQVPESMNQEGTISGTIEVIQWNEYVP